MTLAASAAVGCASASPTFLADLNTGRPADARVEWEGETPFGPTMRVRSYRLGNGLEILLLVDHHAPVVAYHTWFHVGSRDEEVGKTGLAHFFEHLMFNETTSLAAGEFDRVFEENGAETNAATWTDWTYYHESIPASKIGLAVKLESDRMHNLVLRDKQVGSEREVVANERRYRVDDDVEGSVSELLFKTAFTVHPYRWPTIGWMADIEAYTPADCERFYRTYYAPNNASVIIVGDVDEAATLKLIQDGYGGLARSTIARKSRPTEPKQTVERRVEVKKPTATEKVMLGYQSPPLGDADHVALTVLNEILFGGRASRVYRALVQQTEIASDLRGWVATLSDPGLYEMYLTARGVHTASELIGALDAELGKLREHGVTEPELARAKSRLELGFLQGLETVSGKAEQIGFYKTTLGDPGKAFERLEAYRGVSADDVVRVARAYLIAEHRSVVVVLPDGSAGGEADEEDEDGAVDGATARRLR
ncbi:MAG: M16 family metallopeptidase [Polyangiales bacterium]